MMKILVGQKVQVAQPPVFCVKSLAGKTHHAVVEVFDAPIARPNADKGVGVVGNVTHQVYGGLYDTLQIGHQSPSVEGLQVVADKTVFDTVDLEGGQAFQVAQQLGAIVQQVHGCSREAIWVAGIRLQTGGDIGPLGRHINCYNGCSIKASFFVQK